METFSKVQPVYGYSANLLGLKAELAGGSMTRCHKRRIAECDVEVQLGADSLWIVVTRKNDGGFALRTAYFPGHQATVKTVTVAGDLVTIKVDSPLGDYTVELISVVGAAALRCTARLTPRSDLLVPYWPRDLYPLNSSGDPMAPVGRVKAAQRGMNTGVLYFTLERPCFGSVLYLQNFTALNDYFQATETRPDGRVGGNWPELGYAAPVSEKLPLPSGKEIVISDAFVRWKDEIPTTPQQSALLFLDLLAGIYSQLSRPESEYHDWPALAHRTLEDLQISPKATVESYRHTYLHPYTGAEYPDSMVQLTVLLPIREYAVWRARVSPFADRLRKGVGKFFDSDLGTIRRYLPNVGKDKDPLAVDSWYLYHPLANLGRLAKEGDEEAIQLFRQSLDYAIRVARHFKYRWPVQFKVDTLEVITNERKPNDPGQSDVGGLYAYVMLQAYGLTGQNRFLNEAKASIGALTDMEFQLEYQANITGWSANACLYLSQITGERKYVEQSYVFLAGFFHNCLIWESQLNAAAHYPIFLGATCLHDGPYMALYECYEVYSAFHEYLSAARIELPQPVQLLLTEYCKYTLTRAWYYYPEHLPEDIISKDVRNGEIDRKLAFPLEDLYADGQPAGQIGQEIYGSGAAFALVTRAYHRLQTANLILYCEYPIFDIVENSQLCVEFHVRGVAGYFCRACLISESKTESFHFSICGEDGVKIPYDQIAPGHLEFKAPAATVVEIRWTVKTIQARSKPT